MTDDELQRWAYVIDDIVKGKDVELLYPTHMHAHRAYRNCMRILRSIDLPCRIVGNSVMKGIEVSGAVWFLNASNPASGWRHSV